MKKLKRLQIRKLLEESIIVNSILMNEHLSASEIDAVEKAAEKGAKALRKLGIQLSQKYHPDKLPKGMTDAMKAAAETARRDALLLVQNPQELANDPGRLQRFIKTGRSMANSSMPLTYDRAAATPEAKKSLRKAAERAEKVAAERAEKVAAERATRAAAEAEKRAFEKTVQNASQAFKNNPEAAADALKKTAQKSGEEAAKKATQAATTSAENAIVLSADNIATTTLENGANVAKNSAPSLEAKLTQQYLAKGAARGLTQETAKKTAQLTIGSVAESKMLPAIVEEATEVTSKTGGEIITKQVAVEAGWLAKACNLLGPTVLLAFGFYEVYDSVSDRNAGEINDEEMAERITEAVTLTGGFFAMGSATAGTFLGLEIAAAAGFWASIGWSIALMFAYAGGHALGSAFNDWMSVDTSDLFVSIGRQAADKVGVLDTGMFTKWHEEDEWAEDFAEEAKKRNFNGLKPHEIDKARRESIFQILALQGQAMRLGQSLDSGENAELIKKVRSLFNKGFLDMNAWYSEHKQRRKAAEQKIQVVSGVENVKDVEDRGEDKLSATKNKLSWEYYIEQTGSIGEQVKSGFEELAAAGRVNDGNYRTWLDFYNQMRKDAPTMKAIGAKTGSHLSPRQIIKIYDFIMGKSENLKENLFLDNLLWESKIRRKIIKSQKIINLID